MNNDHERRILQRIQTSSPCQVDFKLLEFLQHPERAGFLQNMIATARSNPSPLTVEVDSYPGENEPPLPPPQGHDEATVLAPILNLIETKRPLPSLQLLFGGDPDSAFPAAPTYPYEERVLQSAAQNPSIQEIKVDCCRISFQAAAQLFQLAAKKLVMDSVKLSTERGSHEMLINAVAENDSLEVLDMSCFPHTLDVVNSLGCRVGSNLKHLEVQKYEHTDATTLVSAIRSLVLRTPLEELSLQDFEFPNAESFRSIVVAINSCNTLTKVTFYSCCFDPSASVLLKQLDVASLIVVDVNARWGMDETIYDKAGCYREILQPGSSITELQCWSSELVPVVLPLLHGDTVLDTLDVRIWNGSTVNVLRKHLPTLSGVQHLVLNCHAYRPQANEIEILLGSLERNTSIGRVSVRNETHPDNGTNLFSAAQLRRLQQIGMMNTFIGNLSRVLELRAQGEEDDAWFELVASASIRFDDSSTALYRCVHALASQMFGPFLNSA